MKIFLFDVDGVLVEPFAYRSGVGKTLQLLCRKIGLSECATLLPSVNEILHLESCGIHDVWDMTNIMFAQVLLSVRDRLLESGANPNWQNQVTVQLQLDAVKKSGCTSIPRPNYIQLADAIANEPSAKVMPHPPDVAKRILLGEIAETGSEWALAGWLDICEHFLSHTRSAFDNTATRYFQNIILGKDVFERTYGLPDEYGGTSLIEQQDKALLRQSTAAKIIEASRQQQVRCAIYTARPSLPPPVALGEKREDSKGYSPEAELAVQMAHMTSFPLVGMGTMEWLAKKHSRRTEDLTKPNTTQALSALIAAVTGTCEVATVQEGYALDFEKIDLKDSSLAPFLAEHTTVYVFEDTISGIIPLKSVEARLRAKGCDIEVVPYGIANSETKAASLAKAAAKVYADTNEAANDALATIV
jgi:hypothetical protein